MTYILLLLLLLLCVYSRMKRSYQRRSLGVRARVHRELVTVWLWRGAATAFARRGCIRSPTHRSLLVQLCTSYCCCTRLSPATLLCFHLIKIPMSFRFESPMDRVARFWAKICLGPSDYQIRLYPIGFCHIGLHKKTDLFIRS